MAFKDLLKKLSPIDFEPKPVKDAKSKGKSKEEQTWTNPIKFRTVIEILGAPKEYVDKTLKLYVDKIKKDRIYRVNSVNIEKAVERGKLFAAFAELDIAAKDVNAMTGFCFDYMPSSIEVYHPTDINIKSKEMSDFFNDLQAQLHKLDMMVKELRAQHALVEKNAKQLIKNNLLLSLKEKNKDIATLSKSVGLPADYTEMLLKELSTEQWIAKEGSEWKLIRQFS
jgi:hypothetical protein